MSIFSAICSKNKNTILNIYVICDKVRRDKMFEFEQMSCENVFVNAIPVDSDDFVKLAN